MPAANERTRALSRIGEQDQPAIARSRVEFLITADALAELMDPNLEGIDAETAVDAFGEHE